MAESTTTSKVLVWLFGIVASLGSYIAFQQKQMLASQQVSITQKDNKINYLEAEIAKERRKSDSLQGVIVDRSDKGYLEFKSLLKVDNDGTNTVTITPKK